MAVLTDVAIQGSRKDTINVDLSTLSRESLHTYAKRQLLGFGYNVGEITHVYSAGDPSSDGCDTILFTTPMGKPKTAHVWIEGERKVDIQVVDGWPG